MADQRMNRLQSFASLAWYDGVIEFLFRFVAKTSEPLLAAGIVFSAANVLSKGHLGGINGAMDNLWALSQALAIESSGGVVLVYGLQSIKEQDRIKAALYLVLSALLAITGGIMLFMQLAGWENQQDDSPFMLFLFGLRCVVSVGYIYLCRTKHLSFHHLNDTQNGGGQQQLPASLPPLASPSPTASEPAHIDYQQLAKELAPLLQAVRTTIIEEVRASLAPEPRPVAAIEARSSANQGQPSEPVTSGFTDAEATRDHDGSPATDGRTDAETTNRSPRQTASRARKVVVQSQSQEPVGVSEAIAKKLPGPEGSGAAPLTGTTEERLEAAYQAIVDTLEEGRPVSGRALARLARVNRDTTRTWLKARVPDSEATAHVQLNDQNEVTPAETRPLVERASEPARETGATALEPEDEASGEGQEAVLLPPETEATQEAEMLQTVFVEASAELNAPDSTEMDVR